MVVGLEHGMCVWIVGCNGVVLLMDASTFKICDEIHKGTRIVIGGVVIVVVSSHGCELRVVFLN